MIAAVISIGTNSTRALAADIASGKGEPLLQRSIGTRIGEGLKERGHIGEEPMHRTLEAIREHFERLKTFTSEVHVIATSALRRADNARDFARAVREITHAELQIISGEEEARFSYAGALSGLERAPHERFAVTDTGGGSTEYAVGTDPAAPERVVSCEIGAVRLTEAVPQLSGTRGPISGDHLDRARTIALAALEPLNDFEAVDRLVFVGGTATTAISLLQGSREPFTYSQLSAQDVERTAAQMRSLDLEARKQLPGMNPQRADILLAGLIVLSIVLQLTRHDRAVVSTNDVLMGFLLR